MDLSSMSWKLMRLTRTICKLLPAADQRVKKKDFAFC